MRVTAGHLLRKEGHHLYTLRRDEYRNNTLPRHGIKILGDLDSVDIRDTFILMANSAAIQLIDALTAASYTYMYVSSVSFSFFFFFQVWEFSSVFSSVDRWSFSSTPSMSDHLKTCSFYQREARTEPVVLACLGEVRGQKHGDVRQKR